MAIAKVLTIKKKKIKFVTEEGNSSVGKCTEQLV